MSGDKNKTEYRIMKRIEKLKNYTCGPRQLSSIANATFGCGNLMVIVEKLNGVLPLSNTALDSLNFMMINLEVIHLLLSICL